MRLAKIFEGATPTVALVHGNGLYRAESIEQVLGSPLPEGTPPAFDKRVFSLALAGLDVLAAELSAGTHLEDTRVGRDAALLPPVARGAAVLELALPAATIDAAGARQTTPCRSIWCRPVRVSGRALHGHRGSIPLVASPGDRGDGAAIGGGVAFVLGDDLHRATPREAWDAVAGACLALTLALVPRSEIPLDFATASTSCDTGLVAPTEMQVRSSARSSVCRELGTVLGPWLVTREDWSFVAGESPSLERFEAPRQRTSGASSSYDDELLGPPSLEQPLGHFFDATLVGDALSWVSRFGELRAGDVMLVTDAPRWVPSSTEITLRAPFLGRLSVLLDGPLDLPADGFARIDR